MTLTKLHTAAPPRPGTAPPQLSFTSAANALLCHDPAHGSDCPRLCKTLPPLVNKRGRWTVSEPAGNDPLAADVELVSPCDWQALAGWWGDHDTECVLLCAIGCLERAAVSWLCAFAAGAHAPLASYMQRAVLGMHSTSVNMPGVYQHTSIHMLSVCYPGLQW